jgi:ABC-2 type transport system permease protein
MSHQATLASTAPEAGPAVQGSVPPPPRRKVVRIYLLEAKYEMIKMLRMPSYLIPLFAFPLTFYAIFGVTMRHAAGAFDISKYLLASYGAAGVMMAVLFGFGSQVAAERGQGWMLFKRATPMPFSAYFTAKLASSLAFSAAVIVALFALAVGFAGVRLPAGTVAQLAGVLIAGSLPFAALGLAVGYCAGPNSAAPIINLLALPMAFASGMWIPIEVMPSLVQSLAPYLPAYHYSQLALAVIGAGRGVPAVRSLAYLAAFGLLCLALARFGYRRDEGKTYG